MEEKTPLTKFQDKKLQQIEVRFKTNIVQKRKVKTWTPQQDQLLFQLHQRYPKKWNKISEMMGNRNQNQCLHRYRRLVQVGEHKKIWSPEQDEVVLQMVQKYGNNWKIIAAALKTKTGKQIRQRYINKLDPSIKREEWSQAEDFKIIQLYTKYGSKWSQISKGLPGRPENRIKNRFYSFIQKNYDILIKDQGTNINQSTPEQSNQNKSDSVQQKRVNMNFIYVPGDKKQSIDFYSQISNKENKEREILQKYEKVCQKHEKMTFRKSMDEQWNKQRSLQQINDQNQMAYTSGAANQDFFYFEDN